MHLERYSNPEEVARRAADIVAEQVEREPEAVLLLPAGRTPRALYAELLRRQAGGSIDLRQAHFFQLDELVGVPVDDERSFHRFLRRELIDPLGRDGRRDHLLAGTAADPAAEIAAHAARLHDLGGADLALLGIGGNGHVAFNEPGTKPEDGSRVVELAEPTVAGLRASFPPEAIPTRGITIGLKEIRDSRRVVLMATGPSKSAILGSLVGSEPSFACPASLLLDHADFHVLADEDAARQVDVLGARR